MRTRLVTLSIGLFIAAALVLQFSAPTFGAQEMKKEDPAKTAKAPAKKVKRKAAGRRAMPTGVQGCIDRLIEIAAADPLPAYEGQPSQIINNGLLWSDAKSKCSITDQAAREKVVDLATAWQLKETDKVRSLLQEIKSSTPSS